MCKRESYPSVAPGMRRTRHEKERSDAHVRVYRAARGVRYLEEISTAESRKLPVEGETHRRVRLFVAVERNAPIVERVKTGAKEEAKRKAEEKPKITQTILTRE